MTTFKDFLRENVENERLSFDQDTNDRGYIDSFFRAQTNGEGRFFTDEQLIISVQDFFTGGSGTMSKTLSFAILLVAKHPDWQERIYNELRKVAASSGALEKKVLFLKK